MAALFAAGMCATAQPSLKVYYGLLHAHTFFSDGQGTPEEAFTAAKTAGLDFFAVTPHNHDAAESKDPDRRDNIAIARNHALFNSDDTVTITREYKEGGTTKTETLDVKSVKRAALDTTDSNFIALCGQEFSTISSGNHVNVFDFDEVLEVGNGKFKDMYTKLANAPSAPIVQFNHPDFHKDLFYSGNDRETKREMFNDYGIDNEDFGPDFANLVRETGQHVRLIEVLSGPAMKEKRVANHRYDAADSDYRFYLIQGFHLSPSAGQDNHFKTWGTVTDARVGVFAKARTKTDILQAIRENRTFATEDKNLEVFWTLNEAHVMGENVNLPVDSDLQFRIRVLDANETNANYEVRLYGGAIEPRSRDTARPTRASDGLLIKTNLAGNGEVTFTGFVASGSAEFFYVGVTQEGGERAWTAPIWLNHPKQIASATSTADTMYYWTKNTSSKLYHLAECPAVKNITEANLRSSSVPPPDRTLHSCKVPKVEEEH
jgi:hypothetical protein